MNKDWKAWVLLIARLGFAYLLLAASVGKIGKPIEFALMVTAYRIPFFLSPEICRWVGVWLPYCEILTALFLITGIWLDAAIAVNAFLMMVFTILVTQAFARGLDISCGCFAVSEEAPKIGIEKIVENWTFVVISLTMIWWMFRFKLSKALTIPFGKAKK